MSFMIVCMGILCANPIILGIGFLLNRPSEFKCHFPSGWETCNRSTMCKSFHSDRTSYYANPEAPDFVYNWIIKFDLVCVKDIEIGLIGFSYFFGVLVSTICLIPITN